MTEYCHVNLMPKFTFEFIVILVQGDHPKQYHVEFPKFCLWVLILGLQEFSYLFLPTPP